MYLAGLSWKKAERLLSDGTIAVMPLGSVEEHGPIGPLGTDYLIPEEFARRIEASFPNDVVVLPAMPYGYAPTLTSFPGTIDIGIETLTAVLNGIATGMLRSGVRKFLFLNGHGGNNVALDRVALEIYRAGGQAATIDWWILAGQLNREWIGGHGAGQEAAMMMALRPEWVDRSDLCDAEVNHFSDALRNTHLHQISFGGGFVRMIRDVRDSVPTGGFGGPDESSAATPEWGDRMFDAVTEYIEAFIREFLKLDVGR